MDIPTAKRRSGRCICVSAWDFTWIIGSPLLALYLRDPILLLTLDWHSVGLYWLLALVFGAVAFVAFRLRDALTRRFSFHDVVDLGEAVLFAELMTFLSLFSLTRFEGIPRSIPITH